MTTKGSRVNLIINNCRTTKRVNFKTKIPQKLLSQKLSTFAKTTNTTLPWKQLGRPCMDKEMRTSHSGPPLGAAGPHAGRAYRRGHARVNQESSARDRLQRAGLVYRRRVPVS